MSQTHKLGITFYCPSRNRPYKLEDSIEEFYYEKRITVQTRENIHVLWFPQVFKIEVLEITQMSTPNNKVKWLVYKIRIWVSDKEYDWTMRESVYQNILSKCKAWKD